MAIGVWLGNMQETDHVEDLGIDGRVVLKWVLRNTWEAVDWINLAHDRDQWWVCTQKWIF